MKQIIAANKIFTGTEWLINHALVIQDNMVESILPTVALKETASKQVSLIIPAFIDLQIYGAGGKLLSVYPTLESLQLLKDYCVKGGAAWFQPTVATNSNAVIYACIDAVREFKKQPNNRCIGLHVEGPWINPIKRGAHLSEFIYRPTTEQVKELLEYGKGVITMITLAPEVCNASIVDLIHSYGVVVSAGHSNADYATATKAFNDGIGTATHLYNAMSALQHREPGMVGAIFNHPTVYCSIVPDGYHVNFEAIQIAKKQLGNRLFAITDAVTDTDTGAYPHQLNGDKYESNGILSGSALTMLACVQKLHQYCHIEIGEAIRMCSLYPAQVIQKQGITGMLKPSQKADWIGLNEDLTLIHSVE
ncbi:MAG TPA: N-acetylglucosamine-6-phosphate deacetylase [Sediminibacterium sp.]|jgi:N-acetylglucosamine-6-phosphate deacetylase|nr:N-acetylglucosamine-6-phosphate deacetylase [Sediminibacterium sp.]HPH36016.1 N-acetylglucosamine-6-phosphate deacetylase [Sediminibacterium sp.]